MRMGRVGNGVNEGKGGDEQKTIPKKKSPF